MSEGKGLKGSNGEVTAGDYTGCPVGSSIADIKGSYSISPMPDSDVSSSVTASRGDAGANAIAVYKPVRCSEKSLSSNVNRAADGCALGVNPAHLDVAGGVKSNISSSTSRPTGVYLSSSNLGTCLNSDFAPISGS
jgi:hypothetical protein